MHEVEKEELARIHKFDFFRLRCPFCQSKLCAFGETCNSEECHYHHVKSHEGEFKQTLFEYAMAIQAEEPREEYRMRLLFLYSYGTAQVFDYLIQECKEILDGPKDIILNENVWKLDALIPIIRPYSEMEPRFVGILEAISKRYPTVWAFAIEREYSTIMDYKERLAEFNSQEEPIGLEMYQYAEKEIKNEIKKGLTNQGTLTMISALFTELGRLSLSSHPTYLKLMLDDVDYRGIPGLVSRLITIMSATIGKEPNTLKAWSLEELNDYQERIKLQEVKNQSCIYQLWRCCKIKFEEAGSKPEYPPNFFQDGREIFEDFKEISTYVTFATEAFNEQGVKFAHPSWVDEKLMLSKQTISNFANLCHLTGVDYDFDLVLESIQTESFSEKMILAHLSHLHSDLDFSQRSRVMLEPHSVVYANPTVEAYDEGSILMGQKLNGFVLDMPNLIRLTHTRNSSGVKKEQYREACALFIEWINKSEMSCFIHTTPSFCLAFSGEMNLIEKETDAAFLCYNFNSTVDEDMFFINYSLTEHTWLVTRDKFTSHWKNFPVSTLRALQQRTFIPDYNRDQNRIEFFLHEPIYIKPDNELDEAP